MKKHVILIAVIILVCACAVGLVAFAMNSEEPNEGASDAGEVSDIVTDPTEEITEPITDKPTEPVTEPATEAPTEPVTEAPTEPETEPETVPPTQPKVDYTYIARDTMLDGEQVECYLGKTFDAYNYPFLNLNEVCDVTHDVPDGETGADITVRSVIINTFDEYEAFCEDYYNMVVKFNHLNGLTEVLLPDSWGRWYDKYYEIPEYYAYDNEFFLHNDLIITWAVDFKEVIKCGAELCIKIRGGVHASRGYISPDVIYKQFYKKAGGIKCYEISKDTMDGVDTLSYYISYCD